jgi:hypothetical protein
MLARKEQQSNGKNGAVCPESTIESANHRNLIQNPPPKRGDNNKLACESTIESANRRDFIKRAAIAATAVGVGGGLLLGSGPNAPLPKSSASSLGIVCGCCVRAVHSVIVNDYNDSPGTWCNPGPNPSALILGGYYVASCGLITSGEGISSGRSSSAPNRHGIDFYTHCTRRMSITNCGNIGLGTTSPNAKLSFGTGCVGDRIFLWDASSNKYGFAINNSELRIFHGASCSPHTSFGNYNGCFPSGFNEFMRLTNQGRLGIGTKCPGYALHVRNNRCQLGIHVEGPSSGIGAALSFKTINPCGQGWEILDTGSSATQGANKLNIRNLNTATDVFTICGSNSNVGIRKTSPAHTLDVNGVVHSTSLCVTGSSHACCVTATHCVKATFFCASGAVYAPRIGVNNKSPTLALCVIGSTFSNTSSGSGLHGSTSCANGNGVLGCSPSSGTGVRGLSTSGIGVYAQAGSVGVEGVAGAPGAIPIVAKGNSEQTANLQQWEKGCTVKSVVNKCGWLGIGTASPQTALQVKGGMSLNLKTETSCYPMTTSDFAILANPASAGKAITLPPAKNAGMVVYLKNISTANSVTIKAAGTDQIEVSGTLSSTYSLPKNYASLTLIAGGGSPGVWYILSNAT